MVKFSLAFILTILMFGGLLWVVLVAEEETTVKKVDCFDEFGSKILGLNCEKTITGVPPFAKLIASILIPIIIIAMSLGVSLNNE